MIRLDSRWHIQMDGVRVVNDTDTFYSAMLRKAWYCYGKSSVRLSVCNVEVLLSRRLEYFENNLISQSFLLSADPNIMNLLQRDSRNFGRNKGYEKSSFRRTKALISLKRGKIGPRLLLRRNIWEVPYALSIGAKINDLGWPWRVIMHCFTTIAPRCCYLFVLFSHSICF